MIVVRAFFSRK